MFTFYDIEYIIIYLSLFLLFLFSLKKRSELDLGGGNIIDLNMSSAMKGVACVMILTAHWGQRRFDMELQMGISKAVWLLSANIALVWFVFFSGFGLSLKDNIGSSPLFLLWRKRILKVYLPLLLSCIVSSVCYLLLPSNYDLIQSTKLWLPEDIYYLHNLSWNSVSVIWPHFLGWKDWYVLCIIMFYSLFYLSLWLERKTRWNQTVWLFTLMCIYYVWAFCIFGRPEGHFFRYCWCFFLSHVIAKWNTYNNKRYPLLMCICLSITLLLEGKIMLLSFFIAVAAIVVASIINSHYTVNGRAILLLGSISYFFYLLHCRIGYTLVVYIGINSIMVWILLTLIISWSCYWLYNKFKFI